MKNSKYPGKKEGKKNHGLGSKNRGGGVNTGFMKA